MIGSKWWLVNSWIASSIRIGMIIVVLITHKLFISIILRIWVLQVNFLCGSTLFAWRAISKGS
jgi:hypothetical protein